MAKGSSVSVKSIEWIATKNTLRLLDQKRLPAAVAYVDLIGPEAIAAAIEDMTVRGAPAIGVAAAFGIVAAAELSDAHDLAAMRAVLDDADRVLRASRPTAVNLFWALDRMQVVAMAHEDLSQMRVALLQEAEAIADEDARVNHAISDHAMALVPDKATIFHHCNTGSLATVDRGTALGIIQTAHERGKTIKAYLDETRPRLQGAKLSAFELQSYGVPFAIVVDGAAAHIMRSEPVDLCVVGCDRVAANGDTANKIGTYGLALAAKDNDVPFYVAAPSSTIDLATPSGDEIDIEIRDGAEITVIDGVSVAPDNAPAYNPAFDVTPARLITAIITEFGIAYPPFEESLPELIHRERQPQ
ncbi:MAG: S-methyl-5-thioribose-1-phosphate isomerase [Woeseiaceae bacterium]